MTRTKGSNHSMARRVAVASMTVLASSGIGLVAAPMAFGQIVISSPLLGSNQGTSVTNSGSASANTGGNTAIGNATTNNVSVTGGGGSLIPVEVGVGDAQTNGSTGTANITTGAANAAGNTSATGVGQSGNQVNSFLANQSAGVTNAGSGSANSGGNSAIGNASQNNTTVTQDVSGGLIGAGVTLGGSTNNSTGTATINAGAANAAGNNSDTTVGQASLQGGGGGGPLGIGGGGPGGGPGSLARPGVGGFGPGVGPAPCSAGRFGSFQNVNVRNQGQAEANTGNNVAIGNASQNNTTSNTTGTGTGQTVSGGLLGVGLTIGGPVNNSSGTAVINTGPATAVGNQAVTDVGQVEGCPQVATLTGRPGQGVIVPQGRLQQIGTRTLARTGLDTGDLGMIAGALLGAGLLLVASQRRRVAAARAAAVPMAGFGFGLGSDDWDRAVR